MRNTAIFSWHLLYVQLAGICYSYWTLFTDLLRSVFSSYAFYRLNLVLLLFVSFVAHVIV